MRTDLTIGGFFGLEPPCGAEVGDSVLDRWGGGAGWIGFHNARSAFAYLVEALSPATVWLPAYLCADMDEAAGRTVRRYRLDAALQVDDTAFEAALAPGDLVVAVSYFGAPVCPRLRDIAARRRDVTWLEDRAQALDLRAEQAVAGAWRLYSPRKLVGVGDGGLLVGPVSELPPPDLTAPPVDRLSAAEGRARATDPQEVAEAYRLYTGIERAHAVGDLAMSESSRRILAATALPPLAARRRANFAVLDGMLREVAAPLVDRLRQAEAPFGYPLLVPVGRDAVAGRLAAEGLFCAVHWRELGGGASSDPVVARLRDGMLTLPVDHRYDGADMRRLGERVRQVLA